MLKELKKFSSIFLLLFIIPVNCSEKETKKYTGTLENIEKEKTLRVLTVEKGENFLPREGTPLHYEQRTAQQFAEKLGVRYKPVYVASYDSIIPKLEKGLGDIALASLTATETRGKKVGFSLPISFVKELLIGPSDFKGPINALKDLEGKTNYLNKFKFFVKFRRQYSGG